MLWALDTPNKMWAVQLGTVTLTVLAPPFFFFFCKKHGTGVGIDLAGVKKVKESCSWHLPPGPAPTKDLTPR